jgi:hypothetical protein
MMIVGDRSFAGEGIVTFPAETEENRENAYFLGLNQNLVSGLDSRSETQPSLGWICLDSRFSAYVVSKTFSVRS